MQTRGNLTASYLWQPGELARRMMGERPSPVPPTRELWPPPPQPLSISTLHVAYLHEEPPPRRSSTLPPQNYQPYAPTPQPRHRYCTVGTNTDPPPTFLDRLRSLVKRSDEEQNVPMGHPPPGRLTAVPRDSRETAINGAGENRAQKAISSIRKAISGAKYRIAPGQQEQVDSPKISYDIPKPGDRMATTFGAHDSRRPKWCKLPSKAGCTRRLQAAKGWCAKPKRPQRRQSQPPRLQITQV